MEFDLGTCLGADQKESRSKILLGIGVVLIGAIGVSVMIWRITVGLEVTKETFLLFLFATLVGVGLWGTVRSTLQLRRKSLLQKAVISEKGIRIDFAKGVPIEVHWGRKSSCIQVTDDSRTKALAKVDRSDRRFLERYVLSVGSGLGIFYTFIPEEMAHAVLQSAREFGLNVQERTVPQGPQANEVTYTIRSNA